MKKLPILLALLAVSASVAFAQELPRPSMARQDEPNQLPTQYNIKAGPVLFNFTASVEGDYNSNIGLVNSGAQSDFLITPEVGIEAQWPVTQTNTLSLSTSIGYTHYVFHSQYDQSQVVVAPSSNVSFNIYTGNFKINVHDDFSYQQDPIQEAALSNVVNFDRFENIAGASVLWDLNKVILTLNYDHIDFVSTDLQTFGGDYISDPGALSYSANQVSGSAEFLMSSTFIAGIEAAASEREYWQSPGDYDQLTAGPYVKVQITDHIRAQLSAGYAYISSPNNTTFLPLIAAGYVTPGYGGDHDSYYANLTFDHQLNKYFLQRLSLGHELELDLIGQESDVYYVDYSASWHVNEHLNLSLDVGYQDVDEMGGLIGTSNYDLFTAALQANFPITRSVSGSVIYQYTDKMAEDSDQSFQDHRVGLLLTYHF